MYKYVVPVIHAVFNEFEVWIKVSKSALILIKIDGTSVVGTNWKSQISKRLIIFKVVL